MSRRDPCQRPIRSQLIRMDGCYKLPLAGPVRPAPRYAPSYGAAPTRISERVAPGDRCTKGPCLQQHDQGGDEAFYGAWPSQADPGVLTQALIDHSATRFESALDA